MAMQPAQDAVRQEPHRLKLGIIDDDVTAVGSAINAVRRLLRELGWTEGAQIAQANARQAPE